MNIALILSGGKGIRTGGRKPKQYVETAGVPVIFFCLDVFEKHSGIDAVWIVAEKSWQPYIRKWTGSKFRGFSEPGETRQLSIWNGISDLLKFADRSDLVLIHDAARPFVTARLIDSCLNACKMHDGAMPGLPVKDTMYVHDGKKVVSLLERTSLCAGQTPEAYVLGKYYDANKMLLPDEIYKINGSTEAAFLAGMDIAVVDGDEANFKITTAGDLERFVQMVGRQTTGSFVENSDKTGE